MAQTMVSTTCGKSFSGGEDVGVSIRLNADDNPVVRALCIHPEAEALLLQIAHAQTPREALSQTG